MAILDCCGNQGPVVEVDRYAIAWYPLDARLLDGAHS